MPLTEDIRYNGATLAGVLTVTATEGNLSELLSLWTELSARQNVTTGSTIIDQPISTVVMAPGPDQGGDPSQP